MAERDIVVVTGASSGIGEACVRRLASGGFRVFGSVRRAEDAERIRAPDVEPILLDVTREDQIQEAARRVEEESGDRALRGLVNNAGIAIGGPLEFLPIEELRRQLEVNVIGQVAVTRAFLPLLRKARGRIVLIGSIAGRSTIPFIAPYAASKHALEAIADALRVELRPFGIAVSLVAPGAVKTPIWQRALSRAERNAASMPAEMQHLYGRALENIRAAVERSPDRGVDPDVVAEVVLDALTSKRPRARYRIGGDAFVRSLLQLLPTSLRDRILSRRIWGEADPRPHD